jgi:hypothetical protein
MNLPPFALSLLCLAACTTKSNEPSKPAPNLAAASAPTELDFAAYAGREMTVADFLHACQQVSGSNFTYTEATGEALKSSSLRLPEAQRVAAADFPSYLDARLSSAGFASKPIGPAHLHVYLVERRAT